VVGLPCSLTMNPQSATKEPGPMRPLVCASHDATSELPCASMVITVAIVTCRSTPAQAAGLQGTVRATHRPSLA
jgi:hypothetical protein